VHVAYAEEAELARRAGALDPVHLGRRDRERVDDLARCRVDVDVLT
jgi:hypothetical protein